MTAISAIIATYNRRNYLEEAVVALQTQTRPVDEIVIWDDGSTDSTEGFGRAIAERSAGKILYRRGKNRGKSCALNAALQEATGTYIWICDDDDIALPIAAERLASVLDLGDVGLCAGRHIRFRDNPQTGEREDLGTGYWPDLRTGSVLRHLLEDVFFFQNGTMVRREALRKVGPFREDLARSIDYEMFVRLAARFPATMIDDVLFLQRKHDGARGPSSMQHCASESDLVWLDHDRKIFSDFRHVLPLTLYEALFDSDDILLRRRAGLLQRACVYARRTDWESAQTDFRQAATLAPELPLTPTESEIVRRAMSGKHGSAAAFRAPVLTDLLSLRDLGPTGRGIASELGRGARWRARAALEAHDVAEVARIAAFVARLSGFSSLRRSAPAPPSHLWEKHKLEPSDYAW